MHGKRFDAIARSFGMTRSRRRALGAVAASLAAALGLSRTEDAAAHECAVFGDGFVVCLSPSGGRCARAADRRPRLDGGDCAGVCVRTPGDPDGRGVR